MKTKRYSLFILLFMVLIVPVLYSCSGGDGESETAAWVRIDSPVDGLSTGSEHVTVEGNAAMRDGSYFDDPVYWFNNGASGILPKSIICLVACIVAFEGDVPLFPGTNTITVNYVDGSDSVTVMRYPLVVVSGKVVMDSGEFVFDVTVTLSGDRDSVERFETGEYFFSYLREGSYSVSASLVPPQSTDCFSFTPEHYAFEVINFDDITGLDFTATQQMPCYEISGRVSSSTDPDAGVPDVEITLKDIEDNLYVVYTSLQGYYSFRHLGPGTYTIVPGAGSYIPETRTISITDGNVTLVNFIKSI